MEGTTFLNFLALLRIVILYVFLEPQVRQASSHHPVAVSSTFLKSLTADAAFSNLYKVQNQRSITALDLFHHQNHFFTKQQKLSLVHFSNTNNDDAKPMHKTLHKATSPRNMKDDKVSRLSMDISYVDESIENPFENKSYFSTEAFTEAKAVQSPDYVTAITSLGDDVPERVAEAVPVVSSNNLNIEMLLQKREKSIKLGIAFINSIMKEYIDVPGSHGMKILENVSSIESGETSNIVIRNITEAFWKSAIQVAETPNNNYQVCALGTPGIGKTKTTAILIRLLLQQKRTVIYHIRTAKENRWVYEFKPTKFTIDGNVANVEVNNFPEKEFDIDLIPSIAKDPSNFYIVDPGKTKNNCCPDDLFKGRFILVSSPDDRHWGESEFLKRRDTTKGIFLFYPLWSLEELLNARPYIQDTMSAEDVIERYRQVGGVPRHVFELSRNDFAGVLMSQSSAVNKLTTDQLESIARKDWDAVHSMSPDQPKSLVMGYGWSGDSFNEPNVVAISMNVIEMIVAKHKLFLWNKMTTLGVDRGIGLGWQTFEVLCRNLMIGPEYTSSYKECVGRERNKDTSVLAGIGTKDMTVSLGGCKAMKLVHGDIIEAAKRAQMVVFHSSDPSYKLLDFVYQNDGIFYAFQVTLSQKHTANVTEIRKVANAVGGAQFLQFYYLVPNFNFYIFATDPVNPEKGIKKLINDELRKSNEKEKKNNLEYELERNWTIRAFAIANPNSEFDSYV